MLSELQIKSLPHFISCNTVAEACELSDISRNTYYVWMRNGEFAQVLKEMKSVRVDCAIQGLKSVAEEAVETLTQVMRHSNDDTERRLASNDILKHLRELLESKELADKVKFLEEACAKAGLIDKPANYDEMIQATA